MTRGWAALLAVCTAALVVAGCQSPSETPPTQPQQLVAGPATGPTGAPTIDELKNTTYSGLTDLAGPVTLKNGVWEGEPFAPGGSSRPAVSLAPNFRVTGDLDGDGAEEAVVLLAQSSGGSGTFNHLAVVQRRAAGPVNVATAPLGDRVGIRSARIDNGRLLVSVVRAGSDDARCCPGELADLGWTFRDGTLNALAEQGATGRLSLDTLAGTEWVLSAWDTGEPAAAEPEVTLRYSNGSFAGTSGCNRYTAAAKAGQAPGDVSVGPIAGTRMACPDPQSAVETRFLKQLEASRKFGFMLGRLTLAYQKDGGAIGAMYFEGRSPVSAPTP